MKTSFIALAAVVKAMSNQDYGFLQYVVEYGKSYATLEEYALRKAMFLKTDLEIKRLNSEQTTSHHRHNFMSDWTEKE